MTNTALADHIDSKDDMADYCYARWVKGRWEQGCGYKDADCATKQVIARLVKV